MTMRIQDADEIVRGTLDHLRVRLEHRHVTLEDIEWDCIRHLLEDTIYAKADNSADTGGDYDNS